MAPISSQLIRYEEIGGKVQVTFSSVGPSNVKSPV